MIAHPWLKWVGSKRVLAPKILERLPRKINTYWEPFVGGGAVFFALAAEKRFHRAVLLDANLELIRTYKAIRDDVESLIAELNNGEYEYDQDVYYRIRAENPLFLTEVACAARMIYLNRTCFNGLYRVNSKGGFNTPFGRYTNPTICNEENLRAVSAVLKDVELRHGDFRDIRPRRGDAVYCDSPYWPLNVTSNFTSYSVDGFSGIDQKRLRNFAKDLVDQKIYVLLSNSDTPFTRELYEGFNVETVQAPRRVNSKSEKRGNVNELLISGK